ncbi:aldo/keto reductase, diketogulonate reductase [Burkholderiales bacterium JOSHI_001]|nr:aldo/keto reductase, diketogulonate reductase [Burkholderiales bacterium JOSHI_001]
MHNVKLPSGETWPALGLGTWRMGEDARRRKAEVAAVRAALEIGYRLFDTAEMYGEGGAERVVGEALAEALRGATVTRDDLQVVTKFYPQNAAPDDLRAACERSRQRLQLDQIDLYLLHWRGGVPLQQTLDGLAELQQRGWIRHWGVSNFDVDDLLELAALPSAAACSTNQVYYSLTERGIEYDLLPLMRQRRMPAMAYCPIDGGALSRAPALATVAQRHNATAAQVALAWVLAQPCTLAIPKAVRTEHLRENWQALGLKLDRSDLAELDTLFAPPDRRKPLAMA